MTERIQPFIETSIPIDDINVFEQPRRTFEDIETLADNIASRGLVNRLTVARLSYSEVEQYLAVINRLWQKKHQIGNLVVNEDSGIEIFYILVAGERRLRACRYLQQHGCSLCRITDREPTSCYTTHFGTNLIEVRYQPGASPIENLAIQLSENIHKRVPPHEEARAYHEYFRLRQMIDPNLTLSAFAREVGRSPETLRAAVRYCELPPTLQRLVENNTIKYGIACELSRLHSRGMSENELHRFAQTAILGRHQVEQFRQIVTNHLQALDSGQQSLFDLFEDGFREQSDKLARRQVVERHLIPTLHALLNYWRVVTALHREGLLGEEDSIYSDGSPRHVLRKLLENLGMDAEILQGYISRRRFPNFNGTLEELQALIANLDN